MLETTWADWSGAARGRVPSPESPHDDEVVVAGLSMGGTLTIWLATQHPEIAGIVCVNPAVEPTTPMRELVDAAIAEGETIMPGIGSDIADPDSVETAYPGTPLQPLRTLMDAIDGLQADLKDIAQPVLLLTSPNDHVVPPSNSDHLAASVAGPVERVTLERSYHVATLDYDKDLIVERALDFAKKVTSG